MLLACNVPFNCVTNRQLNSTLIDIKRINETTIGLPYIALQLHSIDIVQTQCYYKAQSQRPEPVVSDQALRKCGYRPISGNSNLEAMDAFGHDANAQYEAGSSYRYDALISRGGKYTARSLAQSLQLLSPRRLQQQLCWLVAATPLVHNHRHHEY